MRKNRVKIKFNYLLYKGEKMPRKNTYEGKQISLILNEVMQARLEEIKVSMGATTNNEVMRFLINDYYAKIEKKRK